MIFVNFFFPMELIENVRTGSYATNDATEGSPRTFFDFDLEFFLLVKMFARKKNKFRKTRIIRKLGQK